jgi:hypothetical protein
MFFSQIELELLNEISGILRSETQLPHHIQLAIARAEGKKDLWEERNETVENQSLDRANNGSSVQC